jgi:hypothetical protein
MESELFWKEVFAIKIASSSARYQSRAALWQETSSSRQDYWLQTDKRHEVPDSGWLTWRIRAYFGHFTSQYLHTVLMLNVITDTMFI